MWDKTVESLTYYTPNGSVSFFGDSWLQALSRVFIHADESGEVNTQRWHSLRLVNLEMTAPLIFQTCRHKSNSFQMSGLTYPALGIWDCDISETQEFTSGFELPTDTPRSEK